MDVQCPLCKSSIEINVEFAKENGRVFCGECCRAFDIEIKDREPFKDTDKYSDDGWYYGD